jgi:hypothetical protein
MWEVRGNLISGVGLPRISVMHATAASAVPYVNTALAEIILMDGGFKRLLGDSASLWAMDYNNDKTEFVATVTDDSVQNHSEFLKMANCALVSNDQSRTFLFSGSDFAIAVLPRSEIASCLGDPEEIRRRFMHAVLEDLVGLDRVGKAADSLQQMYFAVAGWAFLASECTDTAN